MAKKMEISHARKILTNYCQILFFLSYLITTVSQKSKNCENNWILQLPKMIWPNCETVYFFEGKSKYIQTGNTLEFPYWSKIENSNRKFWGILFHKYYSKHHKIIIFNCLRKVLKNWWDLKRPRKFCSSLVRNIWVFSPLVPSKREKNVLVLLS